MGKRGPKPADNPGHTVGGHLDGETFADLEDVVYTRNRTRSFVVAEAIRLGLPAVKELYAPVRASKRKGAKKTPPAKARASKKSGLGRTLARKLKASGLK
jgi:hypothetical protein